MVVYGFTFKIYLNLLQVCERPEPVKNEHFSNARVSNFSLHPLKHYYIIKLGH